VLRQYLRIGQEFRASGKQVNPLPSLSVVRTPLTMPPAAQEIRGLLLKAVTAQLGGGTKGQI